MKGKGNLDGEWLYRTEAMQGYTIYCCQNPTGGLKDKPTKGPDPYHTMYSMAGCSIGQHKADYATLYADTPEAKKFRTHFKGNYKDMQEAKEGEDSDDIEFDNTHLLGGVLDNKLRRINSIFCARFDYIEKTRDYYRQKRQNPEEPKPEEQNVEEKPVEMPAEESKESPDEK